MYTQEEEECIVPYLAYCCSNNRKYSEVLME